MVGASDKLLPSNSLTWSHLHVLDLDSHIIDEPPKNGLGRAGLRLYDTAISLENVSLIQGI